VKSISGSSPCLFQTHCPSDTVLIRVPRGRAIFSVEQHAAYIYHLHEGVVGTTITTSTGCNMVSAIIVPPQLVGIAGLAGMYSPRHILHLGEARAITPVTYCKVRREAVWALFSDREMLAQIMDLICNMVCNMSVLRSFPEKAGICRQVLIILNMLGRSIGTCESDGMLTLHGITHEDLALMINTSRNTITRVLSRLERDGLVETHRREIILTKPQSFLRSLLV